MEISIVTLDEVTAILQNARAANYQYYVNRALNQLRANLLIYNPTSALVDPYTTTGKIKAIKGFFNTYQSVVNCTIQLVQQNAGRKPLVGAIPFLNAEVFIASNEDSPKSFSMSFPITDIITSPRRLEEALVYTSGSLHTGTQLMALLRHIYTQVASDSKKCVRAIYDALGEVFSYTPSIEEAIAYARKHGAVIFDLPDGADLRTPTTRNHRAVVHK